MRVKKSKFKTMLRTSQGPISTVHFFYMPEIDVSSFFASSHTNIEPFFDNHG